MISTQHSIEIVRGKGKVYNTVVRPAMIYGAETWAVKKAQEKTLDVADMRMLRWMSGVTKLDRIRNERIRGTTKVGEISKKVQGSRLNWYGHVLRREDEYVGKRVMAMEAPGKRRRGRPKRRWLFDLLNATRVPHNVASRQHHIAVVPLPRSITYIIV